jgi:hypothetical protein
MSFFFPIHRPSPLWWKSATNLPQSMPFAGGKKNNRPRYAQCYLSDISKVRILLENKQTLFTNITFL